jgi:disulfide bond formation protein DsbB
VTPFAKARLLAFLIPALALAGAWGSQLFGGLYPCEYCHWQRWPHYGALGLALLSFVVPTLSIQRLLVLLAALAILASGAIGVYHAGVEYDWWEGLTRCSVMPGVGGGDILAEIMKSPMIRCDEPQWTLFGISLAGFNAIFSIAGCFAILNLWRSKRA